ncbi:xanthine dehydrogenase family protein molybdopterin-binding subunit [Thiomonas sp.]|uniref:xanthine dehydrogenase family protein molybdopterin-binding subunit n=1 Tax=Thiomonas sp. TaxID=2047785 RepID=UPI0025866A5C|nr:xanthine dehydrogenase family protein molybdopterin-binding subunit [Thiomonas sp.]
MDTRKDSEVSPARRRLSRRRFIQVSALAGGGLLLAFELPVRERLAQAAALVSGTHGAGPPGFAPNAYIRLTPDGVVTLWVAKSEMGQGVMTAMPMLLAEEMDADWATLRIEQAPSTPAFGQQGTGGSTSVRQSWQPLRHAGATARAMLVAAAAAQWKVAPGDCQAKAGAVVGPQGQRADFGALAAAAARLPVPDQVKLKDPKDYTLIGKPVPRVDAAPKTNGQAVFGIDVQVPGMLVASVTQCPAFGGKLAHVDDRAARAIPGVHAVLPISSGVAVVANDFWTAKKGRDALKITWDLGPNARLDDAAIAALLHKAAQEPGVRAWKVGAGDAAVAAAQAAGGKLVEASYTLPFLAHATMEPMNCTAHVQKDRCDIWVPTQAQTFNQGTASRITGLPETAIHVHTTFLGGGFGRRFEQDFVAQAVEISKAVARPVKVMWLREDDMRHDFYRPANLALMRAALGADGTLRAWSHKVVGPSIMARVFPSRVRNGLDMGAVDGAVELPYALPNAETRYVMCNTPVPVGFWRSVGHSINGFTVESFMDEIAHAAGQDPYRFRRALLGRDKRALQTLDTAAAMAGWGKPLPAGHFHGIAMHRGFGSTVTQVAEVSVNPAGEVTVHRVSCAVDCGQVVNPNTVQAQMESAIVYGLSAALLDGIHLRDGGVVQANFDTYRVLRIDATPHVDVRIIQSGEAPGGIGEPGTPPIAPAVTNAVFAATGKRVRSLPIRAETLKA